MTPEDLQTALARALVLADTDLTATHPVESDITVTSPPRPELGDWTSAVALYAASDAHHRLELAAQISAHLRTCPEVAAVAVAGPGFINITLTPAARARVAFDLLAADSSVTSATAHGEVAPAPRWSHRPADADIVGVLQQGHAAASRERRRADAAGITVETGDASVLVDPSETRLLNGLAAVPGCLDRSLRLGDPALFVTALREVADAVEDWLHRCPVTPTVDEPITVRHASRLVLVSAAITVLATGLRQLGASAPERI
ncbi:DALR anticodon-binding domain-containing protein [Brevibacterium atlanticum]|uniref:DALR anticodon-binding domain-containing protein n=1 Tax=Brevibacterium atlanticum TaxID=2697563 RepID=UPI00141D8CED|nr:DALR anticodon-binding domain-containing protein [Brevibacterium atlanticum]